MNNKIDRSAAKAALENPKSGNTGRRVAPRSMRDFCVIVVDGMTYPVENWSPSGVLFSADGAMFGLNHTYDFTIKFKLADRIATVSHKASVVRKSKTTVALHYEPLTAEIRQEFMAILDELSQ